MESRDLVIEELLLQGEMIQAWGTITTRPFQFHAKYETWKFAVFENAALGPWDIDHPSERELGMYIVQRYDGAMTREEVERQIARCADAYLFMIGRHSDLSPA